MAPPGQEFLVPSALNRSIHSSATKLVNTIPWKLTN